MIALPMLCMAACANPLRLDAGVFYRFVSTSPSGITSIDRNGMLTWSNDAIAVTGTFQRAETLTGASGWDDYTQRVITGTVMSARLFDLSPPAGMTLVPAGINAGDALPPFGGYMLTVTGFHMDHTEVTVEMWRAVRGWALTNGYTDLPDGISHGPRLPVHLISWFDAVRWCNARSEMERRPVCYRAGGDVYRTGQRDDVACDFSAAGYRLTTAAEWEYAARGGLRNRLYPWGDEIGPDRLNFDSNVDSTTVAGTYPSNGYGLFDMAGNLSEWIWDWLPPVNGVTNRYRMVKGGSWQSDKSFCRISSAGFNTPVFGGYVIGFRTMIPAPVHSAGGEAGSARQETEAPEVSSRSIRTR